MDKSPSCTSCKPLPNTLRLPCTHLPPVHGVPLQLHQPFLMLPRQLFTTHLLLTPKAQYIYSPLLQPLKSACILTQSPNPPSCLHPPSSKKADLPPHDQNPEKAFVELRAEYGDTQGSLDPLADFYERGQKPGESTCSYAMALEATLRAVEERDVAGLSPTVTVNSPGSS